MIRFHALGVRFSLPLLTLIVPFLALQLGMRGDMPALLLALSAHELAHVLAAIALGVQITEVRLLPFGGSARMENPYGLPGIRLLAVAAAGPCMNLLLAVMMAALAQWGLLSPPATAAHVRHNLVLAAFNLLPALPLDGGRMLYALLQRRLGPEKAVQAGIVPGWVLAAVLGITAVWGGLAHGRWNLSFLLAAVFIIASGRDERQSLCRSRLQRLNALQEASSAPLPVRIYRVHSGTPLREALALLRPRESSWFALNREDGGMRLIEDRQIFRHIIANGAADLPLGELPDEDAAAPQMRIRN